MTDDFVAAAARLAEVLAVENGALAALDFSRAGALLAEKTRAADAFVAAGRASRGTLPGAGKVTPARLCALAAENQLLLQRAIAAQGRVIGITAGAVSRAVRDPAASRYGAQGRAAPARLAAVAVSARA